MKYNVLSIILLLLRPWAQIIEDAFIKLCIKINERLLLKCDLNYDICPWITDRYHKSITISFMGRKHLDRQVIKLRHSQKI